MIVREQQEWQPALFEYTPEISLTESWGCKARELWGEKLGWLAELAHSHSALFFTDIGMGTAGIELPGASVIVHKDGSTLPNLDKIMEKNQVDLIPKLAFIVASTLNGEHINAVAGLAREMKENGAKGVIAVLTSLAHERQDHKFIEKGFGQVINQVTSLKDTVETLARHCDGALVMQPHSMRGIEFGIRHYFPMLPIDCLEFVVKKSGYDQIGNIIELGPDKGRQDEARRIANILDCPLLTLTKERDSLHGGKPKIIWPEGSRERIRDDGFTVLITDDEIRDAGTTEAIVDDLEGYTNDVRIITIKAIMSDEIKPRMVIRDGRLVQVKPRDKWAASSAVAKLNKSWIKEILITDAVQPIADLAPIADKIRIISLESEIEALVGYLRQNWIPLSQSWLRDPNQTGTLLSLDLAVEKHK